MRDYNMICPRIKLSYRDGGVEKITIKKSQDLNDFFRKIFDKETLQIYEECMVVYLNNANETIGWFKVSQGGLRGTVVDNRMILSNGLKLLASSIVIAHNHPSGRLEASEEDKHTTRNLRNACNVIDMKLLDHIILTADGYFSMADNGLIY